MKLAVLRIILTMFISNLVFGIPVGYLLASFPSMPTWAIFATTLTIIPLIAFTVYSKIFKKDVPAEQQGFIQRNKYSIGTGVILSAVVSGFLQITSLEKSLIVDNGTIKTAVIEYKTRTNETKKIEIPSKTHQTIFVSAGNIKINVNGVEKSLDMDKTSGHRIFNVDTSNTYILTEVLYSESDESNDFSPKTETYNDEFFSVNADYIFETPESIRIKKSSSQIKKVLYRSTDFFQLMLSE